MPHNQTRLYIVLAFTLLGNIGCMSGRSAERSEHKWSPVIPRTWDDQAMQSLEVPLAYSGASPKHVSSDYYYRVPIRPIYQSYPVYHPDKEPSGYLNSLENQDPKIVFDATQLKSEADWIAAGELVFDAPPEFESAGLLFSGVRDRAWYDKNRIPVTKEGVLPFMRYVVREKGKVELGLFSCAMCHIRVMPDGTVIKGAQGNFPDDRIFASEIRIKAAQVESKDEEVALKGLRDELRRSYAAPWLRDDPNARLDGMSAEEIASALDAIPQGVCARQGSSIFYPPRIPDLIGVKERLFLDATGLFRQRDIADLMRYAALNQGADLLSQYGSFRPVQELPEPAKVNRYSDEQLYALALFLYSLKPPPNPNKFDALAARGQRVFVEEGCAGCHTPPLYTNNKLSPVDGFTVPGDHRQKYDILKVSVGTNSDLALKSRRGTGYYKVPSLKGVWYRGPFEHNGSVATLEDWLDPRRLSENYVPTGFRGYGVRTRAVVGHPFGLDLSSKDRQALVAFLKTL